jgi:hypothetical protein
MSGRSSRAPKQDASKQQPDKEAQQEQKLLLRDVKDNMFRAAVVPAALSTEEFLLGAVKFDEIRLKSIKLIENEVRAKVVMTVGGGPVSLTVLPA